MNEESLLVVDLSHPLEAGMPLFPGTPPVTVQKIADSAVDGWNEFQIGLTTHSGTHVDYPGHLNGFTGQGISLEQLTGRAVAVDCTAYENRTIPEAMLKQEPELLRGIDFLLLYTGWDQFWDKQEYYRDFPVPGPDAINYLLSLGIKGLGLDTPSVDLLDTSLENHSRLLQNGTLIIENLTNIRRLCGTQFFFAALPLPLLTGDGAPVRAAAFL